MCVFVRFRGSAGALWQEKSLTSHVAVTRAQAEGNLVVVFFWFL